MSEIPDLAAPWSRIPLVNDETNLFPEPTVGAMSDEITSRVIASPELSATIDEATRGIGSVPQSFAALKTALAQGLTSVGIQVMGDSTGNEVSEWVYQTAKSLGEQFPDYSVIHRGWNDTAQDYTADNVIQYGPGYDRKVTFNGGGAYLAGGAPSVLGDIDIRVKASSSSAWRPASNKALISKNDGGSQRGFLLHLTASGNLYITGYEDGTTASSWFAQSSAPVSFTGPIGWVRVTVDVDNGSGGRTTKFYTSTNGATWTQLGSDVAFTAPVSFHDSTAPYEIGSYGQTSWVWDGSVYFADVRDGIDGPPVLPVNIDAFTPRGSSTVTGAPVLYVINGSRAGANIDYLIDPVRMPKMIHDASTMVAFISCSHNDMAQRGPAYLAKWKTLADTLSERCPGAQVIVSSQNPRTAPAFFISDHKIRRQQLQAWAAREGHAFIDVFVGFEASVQPISDLVSPADGVHPTVAGSLVWRDIVLAQIEKA